MGGAINPRFLCVFVEYADTNLFHLKFVYIILKLNFSDYFVVKFVSRSNEKEQNITSFIALSNSIICRLIARCSLYNIQLSIVQHDECSCVYTAGSIS